MCSMQLTYVLLYVCTVHLHQSPVCSFMDIPVRGLQLTHILGSG